MCSLQTAQGDEISMLLLRYAKRHCTMRLSPHVGAIRDGSQGGPFSLHVWPLWIFPRSACPGSRKRTDSKSLCLGGQPVLPFRAWEDVQTAHEALPNCDIERGSARADFTATPSDSPEMPCEPKAVITWLRDSRVAQAVHTLIPMGSGRTKAMEARESGAFTAWCSFGPRHHARLPSLAWLA